MHLLMLPWPDRKYLFCFPSQLCSAVGSPNLLVAVVASTSIPYGVGKRSIISGNLVRNSVRCYGPTCARASRIQQMLAYACRTHYAFLAYHWRSKVNASFLKTLNAPSSLVQCLITLRECSRRGPHSEFRCPPRAHACFSLGYRFTGLHHSCSHPPPSVSCLPSASIHYTDRSPWQVPFQHIIPAIDLPAFD
jgi:hypothetical protein